LPAKSRTFNVLISSITPLIETYGLVFVAVLICLESIALPVPGETVLILAAVFAGTRHQLHIVAIVLTAAAAAFVGQVIGYMIGRQFGYRLLLRYGGYLRITEGRIKLGEYLFLRYGITIVIVARFVTAIVVGVNFLRRHEEQVTAEADLALPGRLKSR
jgi:membrane protein DedA with SNARE-associated domain